MSNSDKKVEKTEGDRVAVKVDKETYRQFSDYAKSKNMHITHLMDEVLQYAVEHDIVQVYLTAPGL